MVLEMIQNLIPKDDKKKNEIEYFKSIYKLVFLFIPQLLLHHENLMLINVHCHQRMNEVFQMVVAIVNEHFLCLLHSQHLLLNLLDHYIM